MGGMTETPAEPARVELTDMKLFVFRARKTSFTNCSVSELP